MAIMANFQSNDQLLVFKEIKKHGFHLPLNFLKKYMYVKTIKD